MTMWRPSMPTPPMDSVTQVGSPENSSLYSGVRKFYETQFHDEVIDELLNLFLCKCALRQISLCVDINEGGSTSQRHCGTVLFLDGAR